MKDYPPSECPRYDRCSVNHCPLDPDQDSRASIPADKQRRCTLEKQVRLRVGSKYPDLLPRLGLTKKEHVGKQRWDRMSASQQSHAREWAKQRAERWNSKRRSKG